MSQVHRSSDPYVSKNPDFHNRGDGGRPQNTLMSVPHFALRGPALCCLWPEVKCEREALRWKPSSQQKASCLAARPRCHWPRWNSSRAEQCSGQTTCTQALHSNLSQRARQTLPRDPPDTRFELNTKHSRTLSACCTRHCLTCRRDPPGFEISGIYRATTSRTRSTTSKAKASS